jgi:uncharacterized integral membrane protein
VKIIGWIIALALAALLGVFAIHNHHLVSLDLWPLPFAEFRVAAFVLVLGAAFIGFILGGLCAWIGSAAARRSARSRARALADAQRELAETRAKLPARPARA